MDLTYDDLLKRLGAHYLTSEAQDGAGWAMRRGERRFPGSILGTAYALSILRYAGYQPDEPAIRRGLEFLVNQAVEEQTKKTWWTRHAVHTILGLTEWRAQRITDALGDDAATELLDSINTAIGASVAWLAEHRAEEEGAWTGSGARAANSGRSDGDPHLCVAWTASALYALARLRERGFRHLDGVRPAHNRLDLTEDLIGPARRWLLAQQIMRGADSSAWRICGRSESGIANTALAVIALSHRHAITGGSDDQEARRAREAGRDWLLEHVARWSDNEAGEDDPAADDGWQHVVWSLAPRACLSAGAPPQQPELRAPLRFAFDRWGDRPYPGWYITGVGKTGYSSWSVVQLGQVLKLAISREDPLRVLEALHHVPERLDHNDLQILLNQSSQSAEIKRAGQEPKLLRLGSHPKQWLLLQAFAREHPASRLSLGVIDRSLNDPPKGERAWGAIKGLAHAINTELRSALNDEHLTVLSCTTSQGRQVVIRATCRLSGHDSEAPELPDLTGDTT